MVRKDLGLVPNNRNPFVHNKFFEYDFKKRGIFFCKRQFFYTKRLHSS